MCGTKVFTRLEDVTEQSWVCLNPPSPPALSLAGLSTNERPALVIDVSAAG